MRGNGYGNMALKIKFQSRIWNREAAFFSSALSLLDYQLAIQVSWELQVKKGLVIMPLPLFSLLLGVVPNLISESHFYFSCAVTATEAASKARKLVVILEFPSTTTHHTKKNFTLHTRKNHFALVLSLFKNPLRFREKRGSSSTNQQKAAAVMMMLKLGGFLK